MKIIYEVLKPIIFSQIKLKSQLHFFTPKKGNKCRVFIKERKDNEWTWSGVYTYDLSTLKAESEDKELKGTPGYKVRPCGKQGREGKKDKLVRYQMKHKSSILSALLQKGTVADIGTALTQTIKIPHL